jgi:hypothetical protein
MPGVVHAIYSWTPKATAMESSRIEILLLFNIRISRRRVAVLFSWLEK